MLSRFVSSRGKSKGNQFFVSLNTYSGRGASSLLPETLTSSNQAVPWLRARFMETITELAVGGENGLFTFKPEKAVGRLPVGKYRVDSWKIDRQDDKGRKWTLQGSYFEDRGDFEITEGDETFLEIGEPVTASLSARLRNDNYEFSKSLRGSLGEYVRLSSSGQNVRNLWKMKATNQEGTYEKLYPIPDQ